MHSFWQLVGRHLLQVFNVAKTFDQLDQMKKFNQIDSWINEKHKIFANLRLWAV